MLLREMTSSAFAHSFKRFARLAVVGLALAGLAGCPGGGGGPPTPTPTPTPPPTEMKIEPAARVSPDTLNDLNECVTNIEVGTPGNCVQRDDSRGVNYPVTLTNQCSIEIGVRAEAQSAAEGWVQAMVISIDPGETKRDQLNCVPNDVQRYRYCVQPDDDPRCFGDDFPWQVLESFTPSTPTPAPQQQYLAFAGGSNFTDGTLDPGEDRARRAWAFGVGATASAAEEEAKSQCERLLGEEGCEQFSTARRNICIAYALNQQPGPGGQWTVGLSFGGDNNLEMAEADAIANCRSRGGGDTCTIPPHPAKAPAVPRHASELREHRDPPFREESGPGR